MNRIQAILLFVLLFYFNESTVAQSPNRVIDSLFNILKIEKEDTSKLKLLNIIGRKYIDIASYDEGMKKVNEAKELADKVMNEGRNPDPLVITVAKSGIL